MIRILIATQVCFTLALAAAGQETLAPAFYVPENPRYTIVNSALDSVRFTLDKTVQRDDHGHLVSISSFVDPNGRVMGWHDFGNLEGPGWAANSVGGAYEIYCLGKFFERKEWHLTVVTANPEVSTDC